MWIFVIFGIIAVIASIQYRDARYLLLAVALFGIYAYSKKAKKIKMKKFKEQNKSLRYQKIFKEDETP